MAKINGIPMIERVWKQGIKSKIGDVYVACSEYEVFNLISSKIFSSLRRYFDNSF